MSDHDLDDAMRVVDLALRIFQSDAVILPSDWLRQPAKWVAAYNYLRPYMLAEIEYDREQRQREAARQHAGRDKS